MEERGDEEELRLFKALSSRTRMEILKRLRERRRTLSELSRELNLSKAALHEHLSKLGEAGLVERVDSPSRKWVHYELSGKGREIAGPEGIRIKLFGILAVLAFFAGILEVYRFATERVAPKEGKGILPALPGSAHLLFGLVLFLVGVLLLHLVYRSRRR
jgi:DNA-binding transcriptional ArsR family regulator